jgi:hypothetical protein
MFYEVTNYYQTKLLIIMKKLRQSALYLFLVIMGISFFSCEKEGTPPTISLDQETIVVFKGGTDTIKATITHPEGIKSITVEQADFNLNRTITLEETYPTEYDLAYAFNIPSSLDESSYNITITAVGSDDGTAEETLVAQISDVVNMYLLANNVTVGDATGSWYDPTTAFLMTQSESDANIYTIEDAVFAGGGGDDGWGVSLAILGQTNDVSPMNAVVDYASIPEEMVFTDWWAYGNNEYIEWTNYPGYVFFPEGTTEYTFEMISHDDASIPTPWVSDDDEGGFYNLNGLLFFDGPGEYKITYNATDNTLKVEMTSEPEAPEEGLFITGSGFPDYPDVIWGTSDVIALTEGAAGEFSITGLKVDKLAELKFIGQKAWTPDNYGWATKETLDLPTGDIVNSNASEPFVFANSGIYDITFNENDLTYSFTKSGEYISTIDNIYMIGNGIADEQGVDASESWGDDDQKALTLSPVTGEDGIFELAFQFKDEFVKSGDYYDDAGCYFYFLLNNKSWDSPAYGVLGGDAIDDNWYVKDAADNTFDMIVDDGNWASYFYYSGQDGTYKMTVDTNVDPMTCRIVKQ